MICYLCGATASILLCSAVCTKLFPSNFRVLFSYKVCNFFRHLNSLDIFNISPLVGKIQPSLRQAESSFTVASPSEPHRFVSLIVFKGAYFAALLQYLRNFPTVCSLECAAVRYPDQHIRSQQIKSPHKTRAWLLA